jgi:uncharacterized membrane protein
MGIFLIIAGIGHFLAPSGLDKIVPEFMPGDPRIWTYLSGIAEIFIGLGLLTPLSRKVGGYSLRLISAWAALALFIAVYPANINMAIEWSSRPFPEPLLAYIRLPLQFGLFYWAWSIIKSLNKK